MSITTAQPLLSDVLANYDCALQNCALEDYSVSALGNGLINTTYLVSCPHQTLVLQKINHLVFTAPDAVVNNATLISQHLQHKAAQGSYPLTPLLQVSNNKAQFLTVNNGYWRALTFIPNCQTYEYVDTPEQATKVAAAFAQFTNALGDFDPQQLEIIIQDFHHLNFRLNQLRDAVKLNVDNRLATCQHWVDLCFAQQAFIEEVAALEATLPLRVTHNDTKINNLLFDGQNHQAIAVIDLDTCMPGLLMHDFGDMVRTCCSTLPEDGQQLELMSIRIDILAALAKGYISELKTTLTSAEQASLVVGALLLPFMIGIRFLTDYLNGDRYFKTHYPEHNLVRASNQLHMFTLLKQQRAEISNIIHSL